MPERIAGLCKVDVPRLAPDTPVRAAVEGLLAANASAGVVVDESGSMVGILSLKDCFRSALSAAYHQQWQGTVADHMTPDPRCLDADTDYATAAEAFLAQPYRVFPVTENGRFIGLLSRSDLLAALLENG